MIFFLISMVVLRPETLTNTKPSDVWRIISNQQPTILMFLWSCEMSSYDAVDVVAPTSSCLYHHSLHMSDLFHFFAAVTNIPFRNWEIFFFYLLPERNLLLLSLCKTLTLECLLKPAKDVQRLALKWFESVFLTFKWVDLQIGTDLCHLGLSYSRHYVHLLTDKNLMRLEVLQKEFISWKSLWSWSCN